VRAASAAVVACLALAVLARPAGADTPSEIAAARKRLDALIASIAEQSKVVGGLQDDVDVVASQVNLVEGQAAQAQARVARLEVEIRAATDQLAELQRQLDDRARVAYENGPGTGLDFLLGSTSISDLSDRLEILDHAARSDQELIDGKREQRAALEEKRTRLETLKAELRDRQADLQSKQRDLQAKLDAAKQAADRLAADRAAAEALIKKLVTRRKEELARLAEAQAGARHGGSTAGAFGHPLAICPVDPPRGYADDFGAPRYGGGYHRHAGNDVFAPLGTPIRAPFAGTATDATNTIGGNAVIVHGPAGYVYNAHLSAFGTLGPVSVGTVIGYVGNTGDARGGATHDHFEWHPDVYPPGVEVINGAIDPFPYLNQVC
jgi:peptidoglycan hydrolase CwlO-like protein